MSNIRITTTISGVEGTIARLGQIIPRLTSQDAQRVFLAIGRDIERAVERRQPRDTGRLKRATVTRGVTQAQLYRRGPAVFVFVRTRDKDPNAAPQAYAVEAGSKARRPEPGKVIAFRLPDGRMVFTTSVKEIRPRPFFAPAVAEAGPRAIDEAADGLARLI